MIAIKKNRNMENRSGKYQKCQKFVYFQRFDEFFPSISVFCRKIKSLFIFSILTSFFPLNFNFNFSLQNSIQIRSLFMVSVLTSFFLIEDVCIRFAFDQLFYILFFQLRIFYSYPQFPNAQKELTKKKNFYFISNAHYAHYSTVSDHDFWDCTVFLFDKKRCLVEPDHSQCTTIF